MTANHRDKARAYARDGFAVFPCKPGTKNPATPHGFHDASASEGQVDQWWSPGSRANIGVWPGYSGHVVLDVDTKDGKDGESDLFMLECELGALPDTWTVRTPSGGFHLWFAMPRGHALPGNTPLANAIDIRSAKGYVLLPPSQADGGEYQTLVDLPIATLPEAWAERLADPPRNETEPATEAATSIDLDTEEAIERAAEFLATTRQVSVQGEGGDATAFTVACQLRDLGISQDEALRLMDDHWNDRCDPPWDVYEPVSDPEGKCLADKVRHAYKYAAGLAGQDAPRDPTDVFAEFAMGDPESGTEPDADGALDRKTRPPRLMSDVEIDDLEPPEWLLDDCIPEASLVALYGAPGSYKSFLALDWAYHLAHGMPWAGHDCDEPRRVLYVAGEGTTGIKKRLRAWRKHHGIDKGADLGRLQVTDGMPQVGESDAWAEWRSDIEAAGPFDLIVFDTLAYLTFGLEENSNSDMMLAVKRLSDLREKTGASIMVVHHTGKEGDSMRGATSILGACDTVFRLDKDQQVKGQARLHMTKQKDAEAWPGHLGIQTADYTVAYDHKGRKKTSLALTKGRHNVTPTEGEMQDAAQSAEEAFREVPLEEHPEKLGQAIGQVLGKRKQAMQRKELAANLALHLGRSESEAGYIESLLRSMYSHPEIHQYVPGKQARAGKVPDWFRWVEAS